MNITVPQPVDVIASPLYPNGRPELIHTAMRIAQGLVTHKEFEQIDRIWCDEIEGQYGFLSIMVELGRFANALNADHILLLDKLSPDEEYDGLIEMDIEDTFGQWFGDYILTHKHPPTAMEGQHQIDKLVTAFVLSQQYDESSVQQEQQQIK